MDISATATSAGEHKDTAATQYAVGRHTKESVSTFVPIARIKGFRSASATTLFKAAVTSTTAGCTNRTKRVVASLLEL